MMKEGQFLGKALGSECFGVVLGGVRGAKRGNGEQGGTNWESNESCGMWYKLLKIGVLLGRNGHQK